jgi:hypothetical protein
MPYYVPERLSHYSKMLTVACVVCTVILVSPLVATDRARKVYLLQYSSSYGRRILRTQFAAAMLSAFAMSLVFTALCGAVYAQLGTQMFWDASIVSFWGMAFYMYDITYGQYAGLMAAMPVAFSVAAASAAFVISRFSDNYVKLLNKAVPFGLAVAAIVSAAVGEALSSKNLIFALLFRRLPAPEVWVCAILLVAGAGAGIRVVWRERKVDVL